MSKISFRYIGPVVLFLVLNAAPVFSAQEKNQTAAYTLNFEEVSSRLSRSKSGEDILKIVENTLPECKVHNDYEKFASEIKNLIQRPDSKNADALYYAMAKIRLEQLRFLSKQNDIESGRLFMFLNEQYYNEALDYLDKSAGITKSKELLLDIYFLKLLIAKEKFLYEKTSAVFSEIINTILQYSNDSNLNKVQLIRLSDKFNEIGLRDYAVKLKVTYAAKIDPKGAQEIFEEMKKNADQYFAQGNMKEAAYLYEQYMRDAKPYFEKDEIAANVMDIAEKYFAAGKYKEARKYYEFYMQDYSDSKFIDYSSFRIALCFYYEKDYAKATSQLESFIVGYQNSIWYDKAFEVLARLYYENLPKDKAMDGLMALIDKHYRKGIGDYPQILIGLLYYRAKEYDNALKRLEKVDAASAYFYTARILINDIGEIKKGAAPSFGSESDDTYKTWQPYKPIGAEILPAKVTVNKNAKVLFKLEGLEDQDKFAEYLQDKDDQSRLPKKIAEGYEKDLTLLRWASTGGKFLDEKETEERAWEAPAELGTYKVSVSVDDLGLLRSPDKGLRKDPARELSVLVVVEG